MQEGILLDSLGVYLARGLTAVDADWKAFVASKTAAKDVSALEKKMQHLHIASTPCTPLPIALSFLLS